WVAARRSPYASRSWSSAEPPKTSCTDAGGSDDEGEQDGLDGALESECDSWCRPGRGTARPEPFPRTDSPATLQTRQRRGHPRDRCGPSGPDWAPSAAM